MQTIVANAQSSRTHQFSIRIRSVELDNIVAEVGDLEGGCITYSINPCDPKVRMFQPHSQKWLADIAKARSAVVGTTVGGGCNREPVVVIGGLRRAGQ